MKGAGMKIATFNANSIRSRLGAILGWLKANSPDVLCVQETKVQDRDFPLEPFRAAGYEVVFKGEKSYNGVAIISRKPASDARFGLDDGKPADESRLVAARFGSVHVINTYVPQGREIDNPMYAYKLEWFRRLRGFFERHYSKRDLLVWAGDLNVAPEAMDVFGAERQARHVCFHEDVRKAFADTVAWGFTDVFRRHHPEPGHFTFFDYRTPDAVGRGIGWRVDHLLATRPLADKSVSCEIDLAPRMAPRASDHTFLAAEFECAIEDAGRGL